MSFIYKSKIHSEHTYQYAIVIQKLHRDVKRIVLKLLNVDGVQLFRHKLYE